METTKENAAPVEAKEKPKEGEGPAVNPEEDKTKM